MELSVKLLAALPARAEGLGSVTTADSPFRPKFSIQLQLLSPDGTTNIQRTQEFSLKKLKKGASSGGGGGGGGGGGANGASRPQPLGHQTFSFNLPSSRSSSASSPCSSSGGSWLGSPASSFTAGSGSGSGSCEQLWAAERAATELRFGVLGKLSDMTTGAAFVWCALVLERMWHFCPRHSPRTPAACRCASPHPTSDLQPLIPPSPLPL